jgi:hemoglobin
MTVMTSPENEAAVLALVRRFYALWPEDPLLAPVLKAIPDVEGHIQVVADFWSHALFGTARYKGSVYAPHHRLPIELEHFDAWLKAFQTAAAETLSPELADQAMKRALHMSDSFKAGLFPWKTADGKPSRTRPKG